MISSIKTIPFKSYKTYSNDYWFLKVSLITWSLIILIRLSFSFKLSIYFLLYLIAQ